MSSLAAARADNFYYGPDYRPEDGSLNKARGAAPGGLGKRAKKLDQGILVIRFEMPFNVWCTGCRHMIAKGARTRARAPLPRAPLTPPRRALQRGEEVRGQLLQHQDMGVHDAHALLQHRGA